MSRFANLEFAGGEELPAKQRQAVGDEERCLASAQNAFEKGDFESALRFFSRALEHNPHSIPGWTGQVRMLIELGQLDQARHWVDKALDRFPHAPDLLAAKSVALARAGDSSAAMAFSDASMEGNATPIYAWLARGEVMLARGETRAGFCFDKVAALARGEWIWFWLASRVHAYYQRFAQALKLAAAALALDGGRTVVWVQQGLCLQALGMFEQARGSFNHALQLDQSNEDAVAGLRALNQSGFVGRLAGLWRRFITRDS